MASFDAESSFTIITLQETIDLCIDGFSKGSFREMLTITMTESFILFDNRIFYLTIGNTMK